jgi:hypothetical protein
MTDNGNAPKSPNLKALQNWIDELDQLINEGHDLAIATNGTAMDSITHVWKETRVVELRDALDWTHTYLINRRDYHRKRQTMQKVTEALLEEKLQEAGIDVKKLKRDAERLAEDEMIDRD